MQVILPSTDTNVIDVDTLIDALENNPESILVWVCSNKIRLIKVNDRQLHQLPYVYWVSLYHSDRNDNYVYTIQSRDEFRAWLVNRLLSGDELYYSTSQNAFVEFIARRFGCEAN